MENVSPDVKPYREIKTPCPRCKKELFQYPDLLGFIVEGMLCPECMQTDEKNRYKPSEPVPPEKAECWVCKNEFKPKKWHERVCERCIHTVKTPPLEVYDPKQAQSFEYRRQCPPLYQDTVESKIPDQKMLQFVLSWNDHNPKGILLHGDTGKGKTRAAWALFKRLILEKERTITAYGAGFSDTIQSLAMSDYGKLEGEIQKIIKADIVFFDELGKYNFTETFSERFFRVIEERAAHKRPTFATTNINGEFLTQKLSRNNQGAEQYTGALLRRLREYFIVYPTIGE